MGDQLDPINLGSGRTSVAVRGGDFHTCAALDDSSIKCFGYGIDGELGIGSSIPIGTKQVQMGNNLRSVNLGTGRSLKALFAGSWITCAILDDTSLKCWGKNANGELGQGTFANAGDDPFEMGDNLTTTNLGTNRYAATVCGGTDHTCALLDNGGVKCWGGNEYGQLGQGDRNSRGDEPGEMGDALPPINLGTGRTAVAIACGYKFTCAVLDDGTLKCWGSNAIGQLGQGDKTIRGDTPESMGDNLPTIDLGTGRTAIVAAVGDYFACALLDNYDVKCW